LALSFSLPSHHRALPRITAASDGITVDRGSQREFCNTIPRTADMLRIIRHVPKGASSRSWRRSLDHLVSELLEMQRHLEAKRICCL
jgi:hypothetical protein